MKRVVSTPRPGYLDVLRSEGMHWASEVIDGVEVPFWTDAAYYSFTSHEIDVLEDATNELWSMCQVAAKWMVQHFHDAQLGLPDGALARIRRSLDEGDPGIYARFDLCWTDAGPKLLELNGDTPTMLVESAVSQWSWHQSVRPDTDQWNSIHERLVGAWAARVRGGERAIAFTGLLDLVEEDSTLAYLADTASQAGAEVHIFDIRDLGLSGGAFYDDVNNPLRTAFKLYPWEDMLHEPFGPFADRTSTQWVEPLWRSLYSTKALLAALWACYPGHPLLLQAHLGTPRDMAEWVAKPLFGREGAAIRVHTATESFTHAGAYDGEGYCYQQWCPLPDFDGNRPVIGSWVIGGHAAGMGIRESDGPITDGSARFVPHVIETPPPSAQQRQDWLAEDGVSPTV